MSRFDNLYNMCKNDFLDFIYVLRSLKSEYQHDGILIKKEDFFEEDNLKTFFKFYNELFEHKEQLIVIKEKERQIHYSFFIIMFLFYKARFYDKKYNAVIVCNLKMINNYVFFAKEIRELTSNFLIVLEELKKEKQTLKLNKVEISFLSETTYNLNEKKYDIVFFDACSSLNKNKLIPFINNTLYYKQANRIIVNLESLKPDVFEACEEEYKDEMHVVSLNKK